MWVSLQSRIRPYSEHINWLLDQLSSILTVATAESKFSSTMNRSAALALVFLLAVIVAQHSVAAEGKDCDDGCFELVLPFSSYYFDHGGYFCGGL